MKLSKKLSLSLLLVPALINAEDSQNSASQQSAAAAQDKSFPAPKVVTDADVVRFIDFLSVKTAQGISSEEMVQLRLKYPLIVQLMGEYTQFAREALASYVAEQQANKEAKALQELVAQVPKQQEQANATAGEPTIISTSSQVTPEISEQQGQAQGN